MALRFSAHWYVCAAMIEMTNTGRHRPIGPMLLFCLAAFLAWASQAVASEPKQSPEKSGFYLDSQRSWLFFSFLPHEEDDAEALGLEFESYFDIGSYKIKNISYFEVADYPRQIPGQPPGNPLEPGITDIDTGINDLLTGFWVSKKGAHHGKHHLAWGAAMQIPTATSDVLGSGQWSAGPSVDYEYTSGRLFAGVIAMQLWSFAGDSSRKRVNMFMAKPFIVYKIDPVWDFIYMPYGITIYWDKPSGEKAYVPLGGGLQRHFGNKVNLSAQFFENVVRPSKGTKYDLRFMLEFVFD